MSSVRLYRRMHRAIGPGSSSWATKKLLLGLVALGIMSWGTTGTYALLNGQLANKASTVASGTLTFSDKVESGTACFSYGAGSSANVNNGCSAVISESTGLAAPGQPLTAHITLTNDGSIDGSDLSVYMPSCTQTTTTGYTGGVNANGNPCALNGAQLYIEETDSNWNPTTCWYLSGSAPCTFQASTLYAFQLNHAGVANALDLGSGIAHGASRYFIVGMQLPTNASTNYMGQAASFSLTWHLTTF